MNDNPKTEHELIQSIERGEWREIDDVASAVAEARQIATATLVKSERMNIRISSADLNALKATAIEEGLPYQTLVSSVLHKYVTGQLQSVK
jgi:predicted DNA binding CopG/RHH family protein